MDLAQRIEDLRCKLDRLVVEKGLQDPFISELSERLDVLITEYYRDNFRPV
ncbi:MAG TPA: sporulation protein Spo0E [Syntrophomonas sp.]|jgi:hypothetical protein|nr:sporulation protein Spo0E [Syntrophomonas sp.]